MATIQPITLTHLHQKIERKNARFAVIGLGYVGLPVACMFAQAGFKTTGIDVDAERVAMVNRGENPIKGIEPGMDDLVEEVAQAGNLTCSTDYANLHDADILTISVQTPIEADTHRPRYAHLRAALRDLGNVLRPGAVVIIESTLAPGTMQRVVIPTLEEATGGKAGERFWVGHCPERVTPGKLLYNLQNLDRVVGGQTPEVAAVMVALYRHVVQGALDSTDPLTAEIVKTAENAYRDVQIAFANELARICENLGADVWTVRELVNKSPGRNVHYPGAGVGGHCIPKDSWLLLANVSPEVQPVLMPTARRVNRAMPQHVLELTEEALNACGKSISGAEIAVLGYAYMENSDDTRDTPSQTFIDLAKTAGAIVRIHDPFVHEYQADLFAALQGADAAVILVAHDQYKAMDWNEVLTKLQTPVVIDARHVLPDDFFADGVEVRVLGKGKALHTVT